MVSSSSDLPHKSLQIKEDDKFYSRLLSKETSMANPSFRVYYGVASGSVPFLWESQPGTPKNAAAAATLPPLTPPPSYHSKKHAAKRSKPNLIAAILPRLALRRAHSPPSPLSTLSLSSSSVSSSSSSFSPAQGMHRRSRSSPRSSFSSKSDDSGSEDGSPSLTLCFGARHGLRGCHSVLRSIVGHGSSQGTAA